MSRPCSSPTVTMVLAIRPWVVGDAGHRAEDVGVDVGGAELQRLIALPLHRVDDEDVARTGVDRHLRRRCRHRRHRRSPRRHRAGRRRCGPPSRSRWSRRSRPGRPPRTGWTGRSSPPRTLCTTMYGLKVPSRVIGITGGRRRRGRGGCRRTPRCRPAVRRPGRTGCAGRPDTTDTCRRTG